MRHRHNCKCKKYQFMRILKLAPIVFCCDVIVFEFIAELFLILVFCLQLRIEKLIDNPIKMCRVTNSSILFMYTFFPLFHVNYQFLWVHLNKSKRIPTSCTKSESTK